MYGREVNQWIITFGRERIILSADSKDGMITVGDWSKTYSQGTIEFIRKFVDRGVQYVKCTDLGSHGQAEGPAVEFYSELKKEVPEVKLIASGGVRSMHDLEKLQEIGAYGVVIGKALHEGLIPMEDLKSLILT